MYLQHDCFLTFTTFRNSRWVFLLTISLLLSTAFVSFAIQRAVPPPLRLFLAVTTLRDSNAENVVNGNHDTFA